VIGVLIRLAAAVIVLTIGGLAYAQPSPDPRIADAASARDAFWRALDGEDFTSAYALLTPDMQAISPLDHYAQLDAQTRTRNGATLERRVMRTTVYDNPPSAPAPGVYIAFDFVARTERADRSCGYIILHQAAEGGPFRVTRTDQTYMDNASAAASDQPADEAWAQMATSFCPGWQRSWAIQPPV
jgi:hypothetical protein